MAKNMINYNNDLDIVLAISGIASPGGALPNKPVGLVHHALATKKAVKHKNYCKVIVKL